MCLCAAGHQTVVTESKVNHCRLALINFLNAGTKSAVLDRLIEDTQAGRLVFRLFFFVSRRSGVCCIAHLRQRSRLLRWSSCESRYHVRQVRAERRSRSEKQQKICYVISSGSDNEHMAGDVVLRRRLARVSHYLLITAGTFVGPITMRQYQ